MFKFNKEAGQVARLLLVVAVIVLVAIVITFLIIKMSEKPPKPPITTQPTVPVAVYEQKLGNIRFVFKSATNLGNRLKIADAINPGYGSKDLATTEKFILVVMGAQNKGTINTEPRAWDIGDIVDSNDNHFVPLENYSVGPWLPLQTGCGALLKPSFDPTPCVKIYDVAKGSNVLKIQVVTGLNNNSASDFAAHRTQIGLVDLIVK